MLPSRMKFTNSLARLPVDNAEAASAQQLSLLEFWLVPKYKIG